ncbi:MAG: hypothetical protein QXD81_07320 [Candidatus Bathyarchaeia archaeon]
MPSSAAHSVVRPRGLVNGDDAMTEFLGRLERRPLALDARWGLGSGA